MASDTAFLNRLLIKFGNGRRRLFRNSIGLGWTGNPKTMVRVQEPTSVMVYPGDVVIRKARALHAGLVKGSGDLIGWEQREIKPEHVGQTWAVFLSWEAKEGAGRLEPEQRNWRDQVRAAGGIAEEVRSLEQAAALAAPDVVPKKGAGH